MTPPRVFIDSASALSAGVEVVLSKTDSHHLKNVLRLSEGNTITIVDAKYSREYLAILCEIADTMKAKIVSENHIARAPDRIGALIFSLCKGSKVDLVCEKACELGVERVILYQAERSVVRLQGNHERSERLGRWERILESAAKQSRRTSIPPLSLVQSSEELLNNLKAFINTEDRLLCCSLSPKATPLRNISPVRSKVHLLIGPEGDLTEAEERFLVEHRFELVGLGPQVLRAETAAIGAVSMVYGIWGFYIGD